MAVIDDITRRYRDALIARERTAEAALLEAYALIWERIEPEALALAERIAAAIEAGEEISPSWLYRQERYRILIRQIESEINAMTAGFGATVTQLQAEAAVLGVDMSLSTLAVQGVQGLVRLPNDKLIDMVGRLSDGSPLRSLLDDLGPDASRRVRESLLTGIGEGQGPREIARRMRDALGGNMSRAMTIARTEVVGVHRRAALEHAMQYSHLLEGWRWVASLDSTNPPPCAACIAMHGTTFPISTPFESHQNCRCVPSPVTINSRVDWGPPGEDWFAGQSPEYQQSVLAPSKYRAYQAGEVNLSDLVAKGHSAEWGGWRREASLRQAIGANKARQFYQQAAD